MRNFDARHGRIETGPVVKNREGMNGVDGVKRYLLPVERKKASVRKETAAVSVTKPKLVPKNQTTLPQLLHKKEEKAMTRMLWLL